MSWDELTDRFTASEMAMMSWSSRESMLGLEKDVGPEPKLRTLKENQDFLEKGIGNPNYEEDMHHSYSTRRGSVSDEGDVDLRKFKGRDIWNYMKSQGIIFPIIQKDPKDPKASKEEGRGER